MTSQYSAGIQKRNQILENLLLINLPAISIGIILVYIVMVDLQRFYDVLQ